jgi:hypothetical protein
MFVHFHAKSAALWGRRLVSFRKRLTPAIGVVALCLLTAACVATPLVPYAGPDPSDPNVRVQAVGYRPTIGRYTSQRPVEPAPWREQNERVTPAPKQ